MRQAYLSLLCFSLPPELSAKRLQYFSSLLADGTGPVKEVITEILEMKLNIGSIMCWIVLSSPAQAGACISARRPRALASHPRQTSDSKLRTNA